jgi:hypothetical protein
MTKQERKGQAADQGLVPVRVDHREGASRVAALRERRLRRQEEGRDRDYDAARCKQERQAFQEAVLYASSDTSMFSCRDGSYRDRTRAVSNHIDSLTTRRGPSA